jgi:hypothetical protein
MDSSKELIQIMIEFGYKKSSDGSTKVALPGNLTVLGDNTIENTPVKNKGKNGDKKWPPALHPITC